MQIPKDTFSSLPPMVDSQKLRLPEAKSRVLHLEMRVLTPSLLLSQDSCEDSVRKHAQEHLTAGAASGRGLVLEL